MVRITLKHSLATVIVAAGVLAAAAAASADQPSLIGYNEHAALGASVYQHNQTDLEFLVITDGTSNTMAVASGR